MTHFVTATRYRLFTRTWKKLVEPRVTMGERTSLLEMTWIRKTSEMERLKDGKPFRGSVIRAPVVCSPYIRAIESRDENLYEGFNRTFLSRFVFNALHPSD